MVAKSSRNAAGVRSPVTLDLNHHTQIQEVAYEMRVENRPKSAHRRRTE
jgi:hypothetical protein